MSELSPSAAIQPVRFKLQRRFWVFVLPVCLLLCAAALLLWQQSSKQRQDLARQQLLSQALQLGFKLQHSAATYARFLRGVQSSLDRQDLAGASLDEQWGAIMGSGDRVSSHVLRLLPGSQAADQLDTPFADVLARRANSAEVHAVAQNNKLSLIAIPAQGIQPDSLLIMMDLRFSDWLREVQHQAPELAQLEVQLQGASAASIASPTATTIGWEGDTLTLTTTLQGQPLHLIFPPSNLHLPAAPMLPWLLFVLGLLGLLLALMQQRWHERHLVWQATRYQNYAYKGWMRYLAFVQNPLLPTAEIDQAGNFHSFSPRLAQILGYNQEAMRRLSLPALVHPDDLGKLDTSEQIASHTGEYLYERLCNLRLLHSLGHFVWVDLLKVRYWPAEQNQDPLLSHELIVLLDQSQARALQAQLQRRIQRSESIFEQLPVGLCIVDNQMRITFMNAHFRSYSQLSGPTPETLDQWWCSLPLPMRQREDLLERWEQLLATAIGSDGLLGTQEILLQANAPTEQAGPQVLAMGGIVQEDQMVLTLVDISEHKKAEEHIRQLAFYDPATGLPNHHLLLDRLRQAQRLGQERSEWGALLLIELDWPSAQDLLPLASARLQAIVPQGQTIARSGPAQFTILLGGLCRTEEDCVRLCEDMGLHILDVLSAPFGNQGQIAAPTTYLGIATFLGTQHHSQELLRRLDMAVQQARHNDHTTPHFYEQRIQSEARARAALEEDIRKGMTDGQFLLYFQPQVCARHTPPQLIGAEVLLRWQHSRLGLISPQTFLDTAERSELIIPLGNWVLLQACQQLAQWARRPETAALTLSVNISARQLQHNQFTQTVLQALASTGAPAQRLVLEISEKILTKHLPQAHAIMTELTAYGVTFSLDDFGTSACLLRDLQTLPLGALKVDLRSTTPLEHNMAIVHTAVALGQTLHWRVLASGVESQAHIDALQHSDCRIWQGYYIGMPQPLHELESLIQTVPSASRPHIPGT